jgi:hypothetical protein
MNKKHIWEKIWPVFDNDTINFKTESFGVSSCINGNILLVGGKNIKPKTIIYDPVKNFLCLSTNGKNETIILSDKYFYKVDDSHSVALPSTFQNKKEIAIVNKIKESVRLIDFNKSDGISKVKFIDDNYGKIIVKTKMHERKRFEIVPKIVPELNLTIPKKEQKSNEQEILNVELKPNIENEIYIGKRKISKRKNNIYLSSSTFYNNILEFIVGNNQENNINNNKNLINFNLIRNEKEKDFDLKKSKNEEDKKKINTNKNILSVSKGFEINLSKKDNNTNDNIIEEEEEERIVRDAFETTINEPLEADIILIEEFKSNYYNIYNFADYQIPES